MGSLAIKKQLVEVERSGVEEEEEEEDLEWMEWIVEEKGITSELSSRMASTRYYISELNDTQQRT